MFSINGIKFISNMPRILRIFNRINVGGPIYNVAYLSSFIGPAYQTRVLVGHIEPGEADATYILEGMGVESILVPGMFRQINIKNDLKALRFIKNEIEAFKPDIIHTHAAKAGALGRLASLLANHKTKVVVHTYHGNVFDGYFSPIKSKIFVAIERFLAYFSDGIISISKAQKRELSEKYKIAKPDKIHVIPLGFKLKHFTEGIEEKRESFRREFGITKDEIVVVITGRLTAIKNHKFFLDAVAHCRVNGSKPFKAVVVGDGELMDELLSYAIELGLKVGLPLKSTGEEDVIFTSWRKDIDRINAGSDIGALTSLNEGTPVSIIEAMASGLAVITTNVGGVEDFINNGENGIICGQDITEFATSLGDLIAKKEKRMELGAKAKSGVLEQFDYKRLVNDVDNLYKELLKKK